MNFNQARQFMIDSQIRPEGATDPDLVRAFARVPRETFVPKDTQPLAYSEYEIETSPGRALWTPRDFALLLSAAVPSREDIALIIGSGAGYEAAVFAELVETVIGLDEDEAVNRATSDRLTDLGIDRAVIVDGKIASGLADQGPYDIIFVNGMVETVPDTWLDQLAEGGRLAVVVEERPQLGRARIYTRAGDTVSHRLIFEGAPPKFEGFNRAETFVF